MNDAELRDPSTNASNDRTNPGAEARAAALNHRPEPGAGVRVTRLQPPIQPVSERFPALERQKIILTFDSVEAREVKVAGDFNGWQPNRTRMKRTDAGEWIASLMLRSGQYEYRFVVDGQWIEDPRASQRAANPYGGFNSILVVPLTVRTSIL